MPDSQRPSNPLRAKARGSVVREPRLAFNAAEEDCCSCVNTSTPWVCDLRRDGICRCFPLAPKVIYAEEDRDA